MSNPYPNKIIYNGTTLIDLSSDTIQADKLLSSYTAHDKTGASIIGTIPFYTGSFTPYPAKGDVISMNLDGTAKHYRIMKQVDITKYEVLCLFDVATSAYSMNANNIYFGSTAVSSLDTWYNLLNTSAKNAIEQTQITQYKYTINSSVYNSITHSSYADYSTKEAVDVPVISGTTVYYPVYLLDVEDIEMYFGGTSGSAEQKNPGSFSMISLWTLFWEQSSAPSGANNLWLRSASNTSSIYAMMVNAASGYINEGAVIISGALRPAFTIDLSKIDFSII